MFYTTFSGRPEETLIVISEIKEKVNKYLLLTDLPLYSPLTQCEPVPGLGFRRGSYKCVCKAGFYFPDTSIPIEYRYYNGSEIETEYERKMQVS